MKEFLTVWTEHDIRLLCFLGGVLLVPLVFIGSMIWASFTFNNAKQPTEEGADE